MPRAMPMSLYARSASASPGAQKSEISIERGSRPAAVARSRSSRSAPARSRMANPIGTQPSQ